MRLVLFCFVLPFINKPNQISCQMNFTLCLPLELLELLQFYPKYPKIKTMIFLFLMQWKIHFHIREREKNPIDTQQNLNCLSRSYLLLLLLLFLFYSHNCIHSKQIKYFFEFFSLNLIFLYFFSLSVSTLVAFAILLSFANGAPSMRRYRRQYESMQDDPFGYPHKIPWKNSCGIRNDTMLGFVNSLRNRTVSDLSIIIAINYYITISLSILL